MKTRLLASLALLIVAGCTTAVIPQAENIKTTQELADVAQCKILGTVEAFPPYIWPGDDLKQLGNAAAVLGADTVFVTRRVGRVVGVAYKCAASP